MITASGAGAAFVAIPPRRLKPKQQRLSPDARVPVLQSQRGQTTGPQPQRHPRHLAQNPPSTAESTGTVDSLLAVRDSPFPAQKSKRGRPAFFGGTQDPPAEYNPPNERSSSPGPPSTIGPDNTSLYRTPTWESNHSISTVRTGTTRPEDDLRRFRTGGGSGYQERNPSPPLSAIGVPADKRGLKTQPSFAGSEVSLAPSMYSTMSATLANRDLVLAVIGSAGVGKTTFIQKALDMQTAPMRGDMPKMSLLVDKMPCNIQLVELDSGRIDFNSHPLQWPLVTDGHKLPYVDGVLLLYDVTNRGSIVKVPESLDALVKANVPVCLVATKCDLPQRQLSPSSMDATVVAHGSEQLQTSLTAKDCHKQPIAALLSMIMRNNDKSQHHTNGRRRAYSSGANSISPSPRPSTTHSRASSEFSTSFASITPSDAISARIPRMSESSSSLEAVPMRNPSTDSQSFMMPGQYGADARSVRGGLSPAPYLEIVSTSPLSLQQMNFGQSTTTISTTGSTANSRRESCIMTDDDSLFQDQDEIPILEREGEVEGHIDDEKQVPARGWTWNELVDRLLGQPMSRGDQVFVSSFLCFYRKFASPRELLIAIMERFELIESQEELALSRIATQIRYCNVLHEWVTSHPGDFAHPATRAKFISFLNRISRNRSLALLTKEVLQILQTEVDDDDAVWGRTDAETDSDRRSSMVSFMTASSFADRTAAGADRSSFYLDLAHTPGTSTLSVPRTASHTSSTRRRRSTDTPSTDSLPLSTSPSSQPKPTPSPLPPTTSHYDLFMSLPVADIAAELTALDWSLFSRITPRDLIRHISVPPEQKDQLPSLAHINAMISHFNHLAYWVAHVILEKPKSKHRARALEKFMEVAWALRHRNNYNSLGAVLAGINGTAVHRLQRTRERVDPAVHKNFMRLELLMGTHKGHSRYRLAWENSTGARIPFLPLHRRDLMLADEGNRTFLAGEKINWEKFTIMGECLGLVLRSQSTPYHDLGDGRATVERLIREVTRDMDEEELYERSVQLENVNDGGREGGGRRGWFNLRSQT